MCHLPTEFCENLFSFCILLLTKQQANKCRWIHNLHGAGYYLLTMLIHGIITYVTMQSERNRSHILRCYMLLSSEFLSFNFKNTTHISSTHTRFNPCCFFIDQVPLSCIVLTQFLVYVLYSLLLILMQTHPSGWGGVVDPKTRLSLNTSLNLVTLSTLAQAECVSV